MNKLRRLLSVLMIAVLFLSFIPASAAAAYEPEIDGPYHDGHNAETEAASSTYGEDADVNNVDDDDAMTYDDSFYDETAAESDEGYSELPYDNEQDDSEELEAMSIIASNANPVEVVVGHTEGVVTQADANEALAAAGIINWRFNVNAAPFNVTFAPGVTSIGNEAFSSAFSLTSLTIPDSVTTIDIGAFGEAISLTSLVIGNGVTTIGDFAFRGASSLMSATFLGNAPATFGVQVFDATSSNFRIYFPAGATGWTTPLWRGYPAYPIDIGASNSIALDVSDTHTFDAALFGYGAQMPLTVTVSNTGSHATGNLAISLSNASPVGIGAFTLSTSSISDIAVDGSTTFTVTPRTGLSVGTYTATVTVSGGANIEPQSFSVSFTVSRATTTPPSQPVATGTPTESSITVNATTAPSGWTTQYRIRTAPDGGWGAWQNSNTFTGLIANTEYQVQARFTAINEATHAHSAESPVSSNIRTVLHTTSPPAQRVVSGTPTADSLTVNATAAPNGWTTQYRIRTAPSGNWGAWQNSNTFTGLIANTEHQVQARFTADNEATHTHSGESPASANIRTASAPIIPAFGIALDVSGTHIFSSATFGYGEQTPLTIT